MKKMYRSHIKIKEKNASKPILDDNHLILYLYSI